MKQFFKSIGGKILIICFAVLLVAAMGCGYHYYRYYQKPKFQNVTIELGSQLPDISAFMTQDAKAEKAKMLTPAAQIDLSQVGSQTLTFTHGRKAENITLTIVDTTAPTAVFHDVTADIGTMLSPEDFVSDVYDLTATTVEFAQPLIAPRSYGDASVELVVKDANGNLTLITTTPDTKYSYYGSGNIVVKAAYSIFKDNRSTGSEIIIESAIITSELSGQSTINLNVGDTYTEPTKPVIVLQNGNVDITDKATITYTITKKSDNSIYDKMFYINTNVADTYTIKYTITYGNYTNTLTKIININEKAQQ